MISGSLSPLDVSSHDIIWEVAVCSWTLKVPWTMHLKVSGRGGGRRGEWPSRSETTLLSGSLLRASPAPNCITCLRCKHPHGPEAPIMALVPVADCSVSLYPDAVGFLSPVLWLWGETWPAGSPCVCVSLLACVLSALLHRRRDVFQVNTIYVLKHLVFLTTKWLWNFDPNFISQLMFFTK